MKYVISLVIALVLNAVANLSMKVGMKSIAEQGGVLRDGVPGAVKLVLGNPTLLTGLICFGLNAAFYMYALQSKALKISIAYPMMVGGGFALIAVVAHLHPQLAERLTWGQKIGVAFVLLGIVLIASRSGEQPV